MVMKFTAAVITVSDKGYTGERVDTSGPALINKLTQSGYDVVYTAIVPDEAEKIRAELMKCADDLAVSLVLTTGGTGFSPRDITPEATMSVVERAAPGIPEAMRAESMKITPRGCLSRSAAGIRKRTLIVNLPGSEKAAVENLDAVLSALDHGLKMLASEGSAECAAEPAKKMPSADAWLKAAKAEANALNVGMYLVHNGVVRKSSKAKARLGDETAGDVAGMEITCDDKKLAEAIKTCENMQGISLVRVWVNAGKLSVGDDIMLDLVGGDIRPNVVCALEALVEKIKTECITEKEIY